MSSALQSFEQAIAAGGPPPADLSPPLRALWLDACGDWNAAHQCVDRLDQPGVDADAMWVHAYLHRKEGDLWNAGYWCRRAGRPAATGALEAEWRTIAAALLAQAA
jgi:hypothetical protein